WQQAQVWNTQGEWGAGATSDLWVGGGAGWKSGRWEYLMWRSNYKQKVVHGGETVAHTLFGTPNWSVLTDTSSKR
ncbi:hypothetical protein NDU88_002177, partial [Pleurodeles waltl]